MGAGESILCTSHEQKWKSFDTNTTIEEKEKIVNSSGDSHEDASNCPSPIFNSEVGVYLNTVFNEYKSNINKELNQIYSEI